LWRCTWCTDKANPVPNAATTPTVTRPSTILVDLKRRSAAISGGSRLTRGIVYVVTGSTPMSAC
jgi:hypothetical protein